MCTGAEVIVSGENNQKSLMPNMVVVLGNSSWHCNAKNSQIGYVFIALGMRDHSEFLIMNHSDISISVCCSGTKQRTAYPGDPESRPRWILPLLDWRVKPGENRAHIPSESEQIQLEHTCLLALNHIATYSPFY